MKTKEKQKKKHYVAWSDLGSADWMENKNVHCALSNVHTSGSIVVLLAFVWHFMNHLFRHKLKIHQSKIVVVCGEIEIVQRIQLSIWTWFMCLQQQQNSTPSTFVSLFVQMTTLSVRIFLMHIFIFVSRTKQQSILSAAHNRKKKFLLLLCLCSALHVPFSIILLHSNGISFFVCLTETRHEQIK